MNTNDEKRFEILKVNYQYVKINYERKYPAITTYSNLKVSVNM